MGENREGTFGERMFRDVKNRSVPNLESPSNEEDNVSINDQPSTPKSRREPRRALADKTNTRNKTAARTITGEAIDIDEKSIVENAKVDSNRDNHCVNNANEDNNKGKTKQQTRPKELQMEKELKRLKRSNHPDNESDIDSECSVSSDTEPTRTNQESNNTPKNHQPRASAHARTRHSPIANTSTPPSAPSQDATPRRVKRPSLPTESSSSSDDPIVVYSWNKESTLCSTETRGKLMERDR
ncbi:2141_t:CDS:2 [Paraglomus brasilianum]|uniref:2141_t:CDS:1 n=1 Tax=Paraglomus brasilianum TaxID=144538 RepID=A0A9N9DFG0_9GLOM|nr:2141_t:CDS:2 [Paraglomus brasilianum]